MSRLGVKKRTSSIWITNTAQAEKPASTHLTSSFKCFTPRSVGASGKRAALYPGCAPILEEVLAGHRLYCGNLFVTSKRLFDEYAAWLFAVFHEAEPKIHTEGYDDYHRRVYGFLSEQLVYVWIRYRGLSHYEAPIGFTQEKAETVELKERLAALFRERRIRQAGELFDETMRSRPDLTLPGSDFDRELTTISRILRDCLEAEKTGGPSPLDRSTDLNELIRRYREQPET